MPEASLRVNRAVRLSIVRIRLCHSAHTHACPGMIADDAYATGPHGETLLGGNLPPVGNAQSPDFDGLRDQEEYDEGAEWYGQQQTLLTQSQDDKASCNEAAPGAARLGHQQGRSDEEHGWDRPHR